MNYRKLRGINLMNEGCTCQECGRRYLMSCLESKCSNYGMDYKEVIESHTSKCSYLDNEPIKHHDNYKGKRIKRGLFKTLTGLIVNADVNGACNIARKVSGDYSEMSNDHIKGVLANPLRIQIAYNPHGFCPVECQKIEEVL